MIILGIIIAIIAFLCFLGYRIHKKRHHTHSTSDEGQTPLLPHSTSSTRERDRLPVTGTKISQPAAKLGEREMEERSQYSHDTGGDSSVGKVVQPPIAIPVPAKSESEKLRERTNERLQQETEERSKCVAM